MNMYVKKPVVIEARQFETNSEVGDVNMNALVEWVNTSPPRDFPRLAKTELASHDGTCIYIDTPEGQMIAQCGDWIIRGVKGEFYPCKPDVFEATYEAVDQ